MNFFAGFGAIHINIRVGAHGVGIPAADVDIVARHRQTACQIAIFILSEIGIFAIGRAQP